MHKQSLAHIVTFLLCVPIYCTAQDEDHLMHLKNEIGVSLLNLNAKYNWEYTSDYYITIFNGIRYKRFFGHHAFRLGGEYRNSVSIGQGDFVAESKYVEGKFNLGYQVTFSDKAVIPYFAFDFIYLVSKLNRDFRGGYYGFYSEHNLQNNGMGFAPALGVYLRVIKSLSVSWEGNAEFLWINEKGTHVRSEPYNWQSVTTYPVDRIDFSWWLNPLKSISLNYGF